LALLLSRFGTILYIDGAAGGAVRHAPPWPIPVGTADLSLHVPLALAEITPAPGLPGVYLVPASRPGLVNICTDTHELILDPVGEATEFRFRAGVRAEFLLIGDQDAENLRYIMAHAWALDGSKAAARRPALITLLEHFMLDIDGAAIDMVSHRPVILPPDPASPMQVRFSVKSNQGVLVLHRVGATAPRDILLRPRDKLRALPGISNLAGLHGHGDCGLKLQAPDEIVSLPMTVCEADRAWMYERPSAAGDPVVGRQTFGPQIRRASGKFVLLARQLEGVVFDRHGVSNEFSYVTGMGISVVPRTPLPPGFLCDGDRITLTAEAAEQAPRLGGPHVVFYGGVLTNYAHWLIDSLLHLHLMLPFLPPHTRMLLPGTLRHMQDTIPRVCDHHDMLRVCGLAEMPSVEVAAPLCWVEDIYWLSAGDIRWIPAAMVRAFRLHILARRPHVPPARRRIYIARRGTRRVNNAEAVRQFLGRHDFVIYFLEDLSFDQQVDLFSQAEFVVAPHGAELANLLFCGPGTKVLELAPVVHFEPYFAYLSSKLGLVHAVLPCPTDERGFFGDMRVDMEKLAALFRMLKVRL
jgi:hypothetical protein